jgi:multisubunit Na+/H+ antiporter MnhC subunit
MSLLSAIFVAMLAGSGAWLIMRRNLFEVLLGLVLFSHGINTFLIMMGGWQQEQLPPLTAGGGTPDTYADPLPMALILTAIVISFGVTAFLIVLGARGHEETGDECLGEATRKEGEL